MDVQEIVNEKIKSIVESGELQESIEKNVEASVFASIKEKFSGYSFRSDIEKALSEKIDPVLKNLDLSTLSAVVGERYNAILHKVLDGNLADQAEKFYQSVFMLNNEPLKISDFLEVVKKCFTPDDHEHPDEESFFLSMGEDESYRSWFRICFDESPDSNSSDAANEITLSKSSGENGNYRILSMTIDGIGFCCGSKEIKKIGSLNEFEKVIINAFFNEREIILDIEDENDFNVSFYDC